MERKKAYEDSLTDLIQTSVAEPVMLYVEELENNLAFARLRNTEYYDLLTSFGKLLSTGLPPREDLGD